MLFYGERLFVVLFLARCVFLRHECFVLAVHRYNVAFYPPTPVEGIQVLLRRGAQTLLRVLRSLHWDVLDQRLCRWVCVIKRAVGAVGVTLVPLSGKWRRNVWLSFVFRKSYALSFLYPRCSIMSWFCMTRGDVFSGLRFVSLSCG